MELLLVLVLLFTVSSLAMSPGLHIESGNITVMPGQEFQIQVSVSEPSFVTAKVVSGNANVDLNNGVAFINGTGILSVVLNGEPEQNVSLSVFTLSSDNGTVPVSSQFEVRLISCLLGFVFDEGLGVCACDEVYVGLGVYCDVHNDMLAIPRGLWIGPVHLNDSLTEIGWTYCPASFCKDAITDIQVSVSRDDYPDFDFECQLGRSGVGCGECPYNKSVILGSPQCWECSNYSLFLILLFIAAGIMTILFIVVLRINLTEGFLYSLLFYCNIANLFSELLTAGAGKSAFFLTAWFSLSFGIPSCFYDGMSSLALTGLHLLYVSYLLALAVILAISLRYLKLPFAKDNPPSKVIATVLVICYTGLLEICIRILSFTRVTTADGQVLIRWYFDPNVVYFNGFHGALCGIAIIAILVYLVPFPLLVISPRLTYKLKFFNSFQPLLDSIWGPLKPKFRWWLSFRLFLRLLALLLSAFVGFPNNIVLMTGLLMLLSYIQARYKPYQVSWHNWFDDALVLNLLFLFTGTIFFESNLNVISMEAIKAKITIGKEVYSTLLVSIAYLLFIAVFTVHISNRFPKIKKFLASVCSRIKNRQYYTMETISREDSITNPAFEPIVTHDEITISREEREQDIETLSRELGELSSGGLSLGEHREEGRESLRLTRRSVNFTEDREPLLSEMDTDSTSI